MPKLDTYSLITGVFSLCFSWSHQFKDVILYYNRSISNFRIRNYYTTFKTRVCYYSFVLLIILLSTYFLNLEWLNATSEDTKTSIDFLTYYDPLKGIKIQYPSNWLLDDSEPLSYDEVTKIVGFIKNEDAFEGDFLISVHNLTNNYVNQTIDLDMLLNRTIDYYKDYYGNFKLIEADTNITLGGISNHAYRLVWIDTDREYTVQNMQIGTILENKSYIVRYYAEPVEYSINIPTIERMLDSLVIIDKSKQHTGVVGQDGVK